MLDEVDSAAESMASWSGVQGKTCFIDFPADMKFWVVDFVNASSKSKRTVSLEEGSGIGAASGVLDNNLSANRITDGYFKISEISTWRCVVWRKFLARGIAEIESTPRLKNEVSRSIFSAGILVSFDRASLILSSKSVHEWSDVDAGACATESRNFEESVWK